MSRIRIGSGVPFGDVVMVVERANVHAVVARSRGVDFGAAEVAARRWIEFDSWRVILRILIVWRV